MATSLNDKLNALPNKRKQKIKARASELIEEINGVKLSFGKHFVATRRDEGLSQVAFAKMLGISQKTLRHIEHDRQTVRVEKAADFAVKLGEPIPYFIRLALQAQVDQAGFSYKVTLTENVE